MLYSTMGWNMLCMLTNQQREIEEKNTENQMQIVNGVRRRFTFVSDNQKHLLICFIWCTFFCVSPRCALFFLFCCVYLFSIYMCASLYLSVCSIHITKFMRIFVLFVFTKVVVVNAWKLAQSNISNEIVQNTAAGEMQCHRI